MPQINMALRHFYRKHPESVEISLESIGETPQRAQPTVLVVCTSVSKVKAILKKQLGMIFDGSTGFGLKVCRGSVLRSKAVARSMGKNDDDNNNNKDTSEICAANPGYQERPLNGASLGAWIGDRHLPPVSFGGLIVVDDKPYGMTVHHMLDDPDQEQHTVTEPEEEVPRSMARADPVHDLAAWYAEQYQHTDDGAESSGTENYACEFSDTESEAYSETDITSESSEYEGEDDYNQRGEPGDIPGIEPGCGEGYIVTQPALDDVQDGFYPSPETQDEDHLDTYSLGEVYASSGIRRRTDGGLVHEIDWALFEFHPDRQPDYNALPWVLPNPTTASSSSEACNPTSVVSTSALPGLEVQCMARTSGLQTGLIMPALTSVKIYGRKSPSHTYQITGGTDEKKKEPKRGLPMGIPGDSGAWIVDRHGAQLCGHVLAWSERKKVAYICPMEVLMKDILEALEASHVRLPGGEAVVVAPDYGTMDSRTTLKGHTAWMSEGGTEARLVREMSRRSNLEGQVATGVMTGPSHNDDDDNACYDEGVEVEVDIGDKMRKLHLSRQNLDDLQYSQMPVR